MQFLFSAPINREITLCCRSCCSLELSPAYIVNQSSRCKYLMCEVLFVTSENLVKLEWVPWPCTVTQLVHIDAACHIPDDGLKQNCDHS